MNKRRTSIVVAGLTLGGLLFIGSPASAQSLSTIDQRQDNQQQRIQQGIDSGALTRGEARHLENEQARIQATEDRMRADGHLSPWERQRLNQMEDRASQDIYRLKHNDRTAEGWGSGNRYGWGDRDDHGWGGHYNSGWDRDHRGWGDYAADRRFDRWEDRQHGGWGPYDPRFERREDRQQYRIQQGVRSGALTPGESRYLEREQGRIGAAEDRMRADGNLSPWERQRLNQMQNQSSRDIYRLDHNGRTAGYGGNQTGYQGNNQGWGGRGPWQGNNAGGYGTTPGAAPVTGATSGGNTPGGTTHGWGGNHNGWNGYPANGNSPGGTTTTGTPGGTGTTANTQGWPGNHHGWNGSSSTSTTPSRTNASGATGTGTTPGATQGWRGYYSGGNNSTSPGGTAAGGTTAGTTTGTTPTPGNNQGWQGNYGRNGQPGAFQPPNFQGNPGQNANWRGQPRFQQASPQIAQPQMAAPVMRSNANMMARQPGGLGGNVNRAANTVSRATPRKQ